MTELNDSTRRESEAEMNLAGENRSLHRLDREMTARSAMTWGEIVRADRATARMDDEIARDHRQALQVAKMLREAASYFDVADVRDRQICAGCHHERLWHFPAGCDVEETVHHYSPLGGSGQDDTVEPCRCEGFR